MQQARSSSSLPCKHSEFGTSPPINSRRKAKHLPHRRPAPDAAVAAPRRLAPGPCFPATNPADDPRGPNTFRWLFPGRVPGQPIDGHSLTNLLNRHGINVRTARNGALAALAADLPAPILADLLGIHINTAVRWVIYARRD